MVATSVRPSACAMWCARGCSRFVESRISRWRKCRSEAAARLSVHGTEPHEWSRTALPPCDILTECDIELITARLVPDTSADIREPVRSRLLSRIRVRSGTVLNAMRKPTKQMPETDRSKPHAAATRNKRLAEQIRKILGKHYASKYWVR